MSDLVARSPKPRSKYCHCGKPKRERAVEKRWDRAIDRVLNSGLMYGYMEDFWRYIDGKITWDQFNERMSP